MRSMNIFSPISIVVKKSQPSAFAFKGEHGSFSCEDGDALRRTLLANNWFSGVVWIREDQVGQYADFGSVVLSNSLFSGNHRYRLMGRIKDGMSGVVDAFENRQHEAILTVFSNTRCIITTSNPSILMEAELLLDCCEIETYVTLANF